MSIFRNSDFSIKLNIRDKNNKPISLTLDSQFEIKIIGQTCDYYYYFTTEDGSIDIDVADSAIIWSIPAGSTFGIPPGEYRVICHRTDNQRTRLFTGVINVKDEDGT